MLRTTLKALRKSAYISKIKKNLKVAITFKRQRVALYAFRYNSHRANKLRDFEIALNVRKIQDLLASWRKYAAQKCDLKTR